MKRPLALVLLFYVAGILLAVVLPAVLFSLTSLFVISFGLLASIFVLPKFRPLLLGAFLVLLGWTNFRCHTDVVSPDDLRTKCGDEPEIVVVRGVLGETPKVKVGELKGRQTMRSMATVEVREICRDENWSPAKGKVMAIIPSALPEKFFAGQKIEISGVVSKPSLPLASGLFDYPNYLATRGIYFQLKTKSIDDWKLIEPSLTLPPLSDRFLRWSRKTLAMGLPSEDEPLRLTWAMTLGWRTAFTGDISDPFLQAGTMHLFAIDGLRIALVSGMIVTFLRMLRLSRAWCGAVAIPLIWFYTAATGWEPPAIRASVMMTIVLGGWALKRPGDTINSLAAAGFVILLWEPRQLFEAGFQLSFFVVLIIVLLLPRLNEILSRLLQPDPLLPAQLIPQWRRRTTRWFRIFGEYFLLSLAAWVGSIPLSAFYFHLFSPVSVFANVVAVPLGTLALMSNLGALFCGTWCPFGTGLFNNAAWFFMTAMTAVSEWFAKLPGAYFYVPSPSWFWVLLYYAVLVAVLSGWFSSRLRKVFGVMVLLFVALIGLSMWNHSRTETDITVLPLNGGHSIYVDAPGRSGDWLLDCGNEDAAENTLKNFLRGQGVNKISRVVLTEASARNCGGVASVEQKFGIEELWTSDARCRSGVYNAMVTEFEEKSKHRLIRRGDDAGCWKVLFPVSSSTAARAGDKALVLLGTFSDVKILFLSDLSHAGQNELLSMTNNLRADVVVAGLPSDGEALGDILLGAINPRFMVIADSEFPATRRAGRALRERLDQKNIPTFYTADSGAVTIVINEKQCTISAMDGRKAVLTGNGLTADGADNADGLERRSPNRRVQ